MYSGTAGSTSTDQNVTQAIAALRGGDKETAQKLLAQAIIKNKKNEDAWLWLSGAIETESERRYCLEHVLAINPNNAMAQKAIAILPSGSSTEPSVLHTYKKSETAPTPTSSISVAPGMVSLGSAPVTPELPTIVASPQSAVKDLVSQIDVKGWGIIGFALILMVIAGYVIGEAFLSPERKNIALSFPTPAPLSPTPTMPTPTPLTIAAGITTTLDTEPVTSAQGLTQTHAITLVMTTEETPILQEKPTEERVTLIPQEEILTPTLENMLPTPTPTPTAEVSPTPTPTATPSPTPTVTAKKLPLASPTPTKARAEGFAGYVNNGGNMRSQPVAGNNVIGQVCPGDQVTVLEKQQNWVNIRVNTLAADCDPSRVKRTTVGWVSNSLITTEGFNPPGTYPPFPAGMEAVLIERVIEGDIIEVKKGPNVFRVRLLGIDAPNNGECFFKESIAKTRELLKSTFVLLQKEGSNSQQESNGQQLRYVWLPSGEFINFTLLQQGFAFQSQEYNPKSYQTIFVEAEKQAKEKKQGLWEANTCDGKRVKR